MDDTLEVSEFEKLEPKFPTELDLGYPGLPQELKEGEDSFALSLDHFDPELQEDKLWKARTGLNEETLCAAIETILFMSDRPISLDKIRKGIDEDIPLRVVHEAISSVMENYELPHHGIRLVEVAEGYQYRTKATYSKYVQDLFKVNSLVLTPTALEVLAIIAYKQPCSKVDVDNVRGVDSGHIVRGLMDKRLVKVAGRSDEMGRPVLYGTTPEFLEVFNLANLSELPPEREVEEMSKVESTKITDIKSLVQSGEKDKFSFDEMSELESLSASIKSISSDTDFLKSLNKQDKAKKDGQEPRSAFDLLEDYVSSQIIIQENQLAGESELMTAVTEPSVIKDLEAGPFNIPEENLEDDDDFAMIDLDTGLPIELDDIPLGEDILKSNSSDEEELSLALDKAFENLTGEKLEGDVGLSEQVESELAIDDEKLSAKEDQLDDKTSEAIKKGQDLNIDLSFLND